ESAPATPVIRSFADDAARAGPLAPRSLGARTVEVVRIVGSVGRPAELGADFRPSRRYAKDDHRLKRVYDAMTQGTSLPRVELHKLGDGSWGLDGHIGVAGARQRDRRGGAATVTESLPLIEPEAQRIFTERVRFERATGLQRIGIARPGNYARLEELVH